MRIGDRVALDIAVTVSNLSMTFENLANCSCSRAPPRRCRRLPHALVLKDMRCAPSAAPSACSRHRPGNGFGLLRLLPTGFDHTPLELNPKSFYSLLRNQFHNHRPSKYVSKCHILQQMQIMLDYNRANPSIYRTYALAMNLWNLKISSASPPTSFTLRPANRSPTCNRPYCAVLSNVTHTLKSLGPDRPI